MLPFIPDPASTPPKQEIIRQIVDMERQSKEASPAP